MEFKEDIDIDHNTTTTQKIQFHESELGDINRITRELQKGYN